MILTQKVRPAYWENIEEQLHDIFFKLIFEPILEVMTKFSMQMDPAIKKMRLHTIFNDRAGDANETVRLALKSGRIQYRDGVFSGDFSGIIARSLRGIGADFIKRQRIYRMDPARVPGWVKAEAGAYSATAREAHAAIKKALDYVDSSLDQMIQKHTVKPRATVAKFEGDFQPIAKQLEVHPTLSEDSIDRLSADYTENMKLWIQKFSEEEIEELRGVVEDNAQEGYRFDKLIDKIEQRYGVTRSKAKFLARQETALFMSKFRQNRFREAGITHYKWSTSHDERVRPEADATGRSRLNNHRRLDGRIFAYTDPPIVDLATGRKANPGEDFNCRCVDIPILKPVSMAA